ncbi:MAG: hypothetical protein ABSE84_31920 [Isosphaeraceae bacterium]
MSIYDDLIRFKLGLLERVRRELPKLHPVAQGAVDRDVAFIEAQMAGYHARLDLWYQRVWQLHGLWLDPDGRVDPVTDRRLCVVRLRIDARRGPQLRHAGQEDPGSAGDPL